MQFYHATLFACYTERSAAKTSQQCLLIMSALELGKEYGLWLGIELGLGLGQG